MGIIADGYSANKSLTTPDSITLHQNLMDLYNDGFTHIVMEASSHALDQYRVNDIDFNYTVFTNLYPEHLDYHGSIENYFKAKIKLFTSYPNSIAAIINIDTEYGKVISDKCSVPVIYTSMVSNTDISFLNYQISLNGIHGTIQAGEISYDIESSMIGAFNAENILCAAAVSNVMGISKKAIEDGINSCNSIPGRMETFSLSSGAIAIVDYAHTPDAYNKVILGGVGRDYRPNREFKQTEIVKDINGGVDGTEIKSRVNISIEHIQDIKKEASLKPFEGEAKVFIIEGAQNMTLEASNALLKILEEPYDLVFFVLTTSSTAHLPETIISRCQVLSLRSVKKSEIAENLSNIYGLDHLESNNLSSLSRGRPGWAVAAVKDAATKI